MDKNYVQYTGTKQEQAKLIYTLLREAAELLSVCQGWWEDVNFLRNGGHIIYFVDADVVSMAINPKSMAAYGHTFSVRKDKQEEIDASVTAMLAAAIFAKVSSDIGPLAELGSAPIVVLPKHATELLKYREVLIAERKSQDVNLNKINATSITASIENALTSKSENIEDDLLCALNEHDVDFQRAAVSLFDDPLVRLDSIFAYSRLLSLPEFMRDGASTDSKQAPNSQSFTKNSPELKAFVDAIAKVAPLIPNKIGYWHSAIIESESVGKKKSIFADAEALTLLQLISEYFATATESSKIRCVLITGSNRLIQTAKVFAKREQLSENWATLHIRKPTAFLASDALLSNNSSLGRTDSNQFDLIEYLNLFYPPAVITHFATEKESHGRPFKLLDIKKLDATVLKLQQLSADQDIVLFLGRGLDERVNNWCNLIVAQSSQLSLSGEGYLRQIIGEQDQDIISKILTAAKTEQTSELYSHASKFGLLATQRSEGTKRAPWIHFDCKPEAATYVKNIFKVINNDSQIANTVNIYEQVVAAEKQLNQEADVYFQLLILGLAYAHQGHFQAALTNCNQALTGVQLLNPGLKATTKINGREAAYLGAVCNRRISENESDLNRSKQLLLKAIQADENDQQEKYSDMLDEGIDPRFVVESIAQETHEFMLAAYLRGENIENIASPVLACLKKALTTENKLASLKIQIEIIFTIKSNDDSGRDYFEWVTNQLRINIFNLVLILGVAEMTRSSLLNDESLGNNVKRLLKLVTNRTQDGDLGFEAYIVHFTEALINGKALPKKLISSKPIVGSNELDIKRFGTLFNLFKMSK